MKMAPKTTLNNSKTILIYNDEGTSSVEVLYKSLESSLRSLVQEGGNDTKSYDIILVGADDVRNGTCFQNATLFIMPGGRDLPYVAKLAGEGLANIQNFIKSGGCYLGLCAGAYFAAGFCEFEKGTKMEVCGSRELSFFPGKACGCVFPGFQYGSEEGARIVDVIIQERYSVNKQERSLPCYYNGGCEFVFMNSPCSNSADVIAKYKEFPDKIAIVLCRVGQGKALLSGVHPEMDYEFIDKSKFTNAMLKTIETSSEEQRILFNQMLKLLLD